MFGILLAFTLGIIFTEYVRVKGEENRVNSIVRDILKEAEKILSELRDESKGQLYSATWHSVKGAGMPTRISPTLRKALSDMFLDLEIYNDNLRHLEEYSILSDAQQKMKEFFEEEYLGARNDLQKTASNVLDIAKKLGIQW